MKEADFSRWVTACAEMCGWRCLHVPAPMRHSRTTGWVGAREAAGLPDLLLIHHDPPRIVFAELKSSNGRLSDQQRDVLRALRDAADGDERVGVYVWQPGLEQAIEDLLRSKVLT